MDLAVNNPDGKYTKLENAFQVTKVETKPVWYLAEGSSDWGFTTYVSIHNPNNEAVTVKVTYMTDTGPVRRGDLPIPANSTVTLNSINDIGVADFSTKVECLEGKTIAVDRTMLWEGDAHSSIGVTEPADNWYLSEGSSKWGFETWLLIQNPNDQNSNCHITFMTESNRSLKFDVTIPAKTRRTYNMANFIGQEDASTRVQSDVAVIAERTMYQNDREKGHCSIGATTPNEDYYLAEGSTDWGFTTYVLVQNPNDNASEVTIDYMTSNGSVPQPSFTMAPNSRKTIRVNDVLPNKDMSTHVHGSSPVVAERAMYWNNGTKEACHASIGLSEPHKTYYLPFGKTSEGWETWTLVQNPNKKQITVLVTYYSTDGVKQVADTIPAASRMTYCMSDTVPDGEAGITVESDDNIMVERSMYLNNRGAGTDTIGGYSD